MPLKEDVKGCKGNNVPVSLRYNIQLCAPIFFLVKSRTFESWCLSAFVVVFIR